MRYNILYREKGTRQWNLLFLPIAKSMGLPTDSADLQGILPILGGMQQINAGIEYCIVPSEFLAQAKVPVCEQAQINNQAHSLGIVEELLAATKGGN